MAFFLVDRDRSDGSLRLLSVNSFLTREDAMTALPGLIAAGGSDARDVFVCDIDAAMPVLLVPRLAVPPGVAEAIPEPIDEPPAAMTETDAAILEEPTAGVWEAPVVTPLESEGELPVPELTTTEWPLANVEQVEVEEAEAVPDVGEALEEDVCEPIEASAVLSEDDNLSVAPVVAEQEATETLVETEPVVALTEELPVVETAPFGYEPGELDFGDYTCNECIYGNTCPKAETSSPAECGSFQWKSV
ncbi:MAG: hypothetical protein U1F44_01900 [Coriobacteriia bacterium]|nr:hypothetical protein [Coriobacteriia bacterium]